MITPLVLVLVAYLLGSIPTSYIVARVTRDIDLRQHGSGNLGATNAFRVLGWKAAVPVFIFDILKGWVPVYVFPRWDGQSAATWALAYGMAAILGHVFSVYVNFRGGKGIATSAGVFIALAPLSVLVGLVAWLVVLFATRIVSVASLVAAVVLPTAVAVLQGAGPVLWLAVGLAAFVFYAHRANIRRLLRGEEHRFGRRVREAG